jgi:hypothetical protein
MPVEKWVKDLTEEVLGETKMKIGAILQHPKHGRVIITEGQYWGVHGLSNFWSWRKVDADDKPFGETYDGYGWC